MTSFHIVLIGTFSCIALYLFATSPPELTDGDVSTYACQHEVEDLFEAVNHINAAARGIYTKRIVGGGMAAGLKFGEEWREPDVEQGPLPALFLRETAAHLEAMPPRLGLYLGSDAPVNQSNLFGAGQMKAFTQVKLTRAPVFAKDEIAGHVAMYPDLASVTPCVRCHNEHPDSPKKDWVLNDVMGATTWTYPSTYLSTEEFWSVVEAMFSAVSKTYVSFLAKTAQFSKTPMLGTQWPEAARYHLPNNEVFMAAVRAKAAPELIRIMLDSGSSASEGVAGSTAGAAASEAEGDVSCEY
ncbi:hypothetical protein NBRC116594_33470 [Shimia sp. NS0008-38b]|uniref:DUF3365 domain-containing protein n=1 Tax=Shimia sp. NS0008-38b TaxID=3127653 RepID=UPI0031096076